MGFWVFAYVGWAIVYSGGALFIVFLTLKFIGRGLALRYWPLIASIFFFIFLTQHPFPDRSGMQCPAVGGGLDLQLFSYLDELQRIFDEGGGFAGMMRNLTLASMLMNFVICVAIGIFCSQAGLSFWASASLAAVLTTTVEVSQLTGIFWIFPCAYREFSVNDMFLNITGVIFGTLMDKFLFASRLK